MFTKALLPRIGLFNSEICQISKGLNRLSLSSTLLATRSPIGLTSVKLFHTSKKGLDTNAAPAKADQSASSLFASTLKTIEESPDVDKHGNPVEREYNYSTKNFKIGLRKLMLLANQISGLSINQAILQMQFSQKRASKKIMNSLCLARKNAGLQKDFDPERMYICRAWVGKGIYIKKLIDIKGRGRFGLKEHQFCHMKFQFNEKVANPPPMIQGMNDRRNIKGFKVRRNVWMPHRDERPIYNPKPYYNW